MNRIGILHYAGPPVVGGVEYTIYHQARLLAEAGYGVDVIAGRGEPFHPKVSFHLIPEMDSRHAEVLETGQALARGQVVPAFIDLRDRLANDLRPVLAGTRVCIVHNAVSLHKNLALTAALRLLSDEGVTPKPVPAPKLVPAPELVPALIAWCHDFAWQDTLYTPDMHSGYPWDLLRSPWPGVRYVVVSEHRRALLAAILDLPEEAIRVVNPGVDIAGFLKLEPLTQDLVMKLGLREAEPLLLLPSRITRRKNIQFAIRVMAALKKRMPGAALLVTGPPGPHNPTNQAYLDSLLQQREEFGVASSVHFLYEQGEDGQPLHVPDRVVADLYRLADLLFFPSFQEGFGIPVLEAGAARLPVFAADIPPVRESAGELAQLFDPNGDPAEAASRISEFLQKDRAYQLKRRVSSRFAWEAILKNDLLPLLKEVSKK